MRGYYVIFFKKRRDFFRENEIGEKESKHGIKKFFIQ